MSYDNLPPECLLRVLRFLSLHDAAALLTTSKAWNTLIGNNESYVYARLAFNHGFISSPSTSLDMTRQGWISQAVQAVQTWKEYCRVLLGTKRRLEGKESAFVDADIFGSKQEVVPHGFKIDVDKKLLVMTARRPGSSLLVHSLQNPNHTDSLFRIDGIKTFSHVEMSNGFIVFTSTDSVALEVWRWAEDQYNDPVSSSPEPHQLYAYQVAMTTYQYSLTSPTRGELVPVGMLRHPGSIQTLRLAYPSLCVGSQDGAYLWLWDIRARQLVQTINISAAIDVPAAKVRYVDVNETHIFTAGDGRLAATVGAPKPRTVEGNCFPQIVIHRYSSDQEMPFWAPSGDYVVAIHVAPNGQDFVAITHHGWVLHVAQFDSGGRPQSQTEPSRRAELEPRISVTRVSSIFLSHLAYDGERIILGGDRGVCMIALEPHRNDWPPNPSEPELFPFPGQYASLIPPFAGEGGRYESRSCLQLTREGFWVVWPVDLALQREVPFRRTRKAIGRIDFTRAKMLDQSKSRRLSL